MDMRERICREIEYMAGLGKGELGYSDNIWERGIDSLTAIQLVAMLENEYDVSIPDDRIRDMVSVDAVVKLVEEIKGE